MPRTSGLLLHPTSLPGRYGIGELGPTATEFVAALGRTRQRWWQMLPIGPTGYADSPYQSPSTFAGNPLLISFDRLLDDGLVRPSELARFPEFPDERVDYGSVIPARMRVLSQVAAHFDDRASAELREAFAGFCVAAGWLENWALFSALKGRYRRRPWHQWPSPLASRQPEALEAAREAFARQIHGAKVLQFLFARQWQRLRQDASAERIGLIGDIPIFVAHDSADVWSRHELFHLDGAGLPTVVAGVPPDYFSRTGQRWGNPLYRWERHEAEGFAWWKARLRHAFSLFDLVRVDHFRGFAGYWEIPASAPTAETGRWVTAPGRALLEAVRDDYGRLPIIAEDLGVITPDVEQLRDGLGLPGMRVLQFGFAGDPDHQAHHPSRHLQKAVCYTGTHDNNTTVGWFWGTNARHDRRRLNKERRAVLREVGTRGDEINWDLIELSMRSVCDTVIVPVQDLLGLGSEARMNTPAVESGNWAWRMLPGAITDHIEKRLRLLTEAAGRAV